MSRRTSTAEAGSASQRPLTEITPPTIFEELRRGVLGQDRALRFIAVSVYKHVTGKVPGNILLIGNSGTGKTTIMNNLQRLYHEVPEYEPFRAVTILNANLLVDSERLEFRPDRLMGAVEQRARTMLGERPTVRELQETMERATVCIDEIDKMSTIVAGKPNPVGVVLQQGLLTLMEGEHLAYQCRAWVDGSEQQVVLDLHTRGMMFICGGAFEGLWDQVYYRVTAPGSGERLKTQTTRNAEGQVRIETHFSLADYMKPRDLFDFGIVPQFLARFDKTVLLRDLDLPVLKEILLHSLDSPFVRSRQFFRVLGIELELEELAAALIAEEAAKDSRTGARALRPIFGDIINPFEFDPLASDTLQENGDHKRLTITADLVRRALR